MKYSIEAIAFDIDGTLYPAWRFNLSIIPYLFKHIRFMNAFNKARKQIRKIQNQDPNHIFPDFFNFQAKLISKYTGKSEDETFLFLEKNIYNGWKKRFIKIKPYPFAKQAIEQFKKSGLKIALLSDFPPEQKNDVWGILPFCDAVLGSEKIGALKPSHIPFSTLSEVLGIPPNKILYVGNNLRYDVAGAKQVGMYTACIKNRCFIFYKKLFAKKSLKNPDIYFSNYRQLLQFVL